MRDTSRREERIAGSETDGVITATNFHFAFHHVEGFLLAVMYMGGERASRRGDQLDQREGAVGLFPIQQDASDRPENIQRRDLFGGGRGQRQRHSTPRL